MSLFSKETIRRLKAIPILEVARRLNIDVKNKTALCWLHGDTNASFSFDLKRNRWKCFGCDAKGGVIELVTAKTGLSFPDSCEWLCGEFSISHRFSRHININGIKAIVKPEIKEFLPDSEVYQWIIDNAVISSAAKEYIVTKRHFPESIIEQYKIRSSSGNDGLLKKCIEKFGQERLIKCGVATIKGNGNIGFTWIGNVILLPYFNQDNNIIYIQARKIFSIPSAKYIGLNGIETVPYNMSILNKMVEGDTLVFCEGALDCISLGLLGKNGIGIIGANGFKRKYTSLFKPFSIVVIPDNDEAGTKLASTIKEEFFRIGKVVKIISLPQEYKDITDYYESTTKKDKQGG